MSTSRPPTFIAVATKQSTYATIPPAQCTAVSPPLLPECIHVKATDNSPDKQLMSSSGYKWAKMCIAISKQFKEFGTSWELENKLSSLGDTRYCPKGRQF